MCQVVLKAIELKLVLNLDSGPGRSIQIQHTDCLRRRNFERFALAIKMENIWGWCRHWGGLDALRLVQEMFKICWSTKDLKWLINSFQLNALYIVFILEYPRLPLATMEHD
eukprot:TRINITY_DN49269_c0_g1_i1.p1 TRINITY_DN49269_c0_g1~~TRINITY_DN49269_c0_g1_i1.p1  ORF type:complete len:111 (+),score=6.81 TRINITY_DN49269_c0_g1_i1:231-563(+)